MILVTGGTGLTGSHLLLYLVRKNLHVRAIYRNTQSIEKTKNLFKLYSPENSTLFEQIEWVQADITDISSLEPAFKNIDQIYHAAAIVSFHPKDKNLLHLTNVMGTENMVNLALEKGIKKFLHISSIAALGQYDNPVTEKTHWNWKEHHSEYAVTKYLSEMEVWRASQEGLPVVIVNPSIILGAGFWQQGTGKIFQQIEQKKIRFYPPGGNGFIDVWDLVKTMYTLMESPVTNEAYIVSAYNLSYKNLLNEIADNLNKPKPKYKIPKWSGKLIGVLNSLPFLRKNIYLSKNLKESLFNITNYSPEKLIEQFNIQFIPFKSSIRNIAEQYKKHKK